MKTTNQSTNAIILQEKTRLEFQVFCESDLIIPANASPYQQVEASKETATILAKDETFVHAMNGLSKGDLEYLLCYNMPIDSHLCNPPTDGLRPQNKPTWVSEMCLLSMLQVANINPLSYWEEKSDDLIHQVAPSLNNENTRSNGGKIELGMHSDNSILKKEFRPEFLGLLSLINEPGTATSIASVKKAFGLLSKKHQQILQQPFFRVKTPDSFDKAFGNKKIASEYRSIVTRDDCGRLHAAGNLYAVECKEKSAQIALDAFGEALNDVSESLVLLPGMALIFNNGMVFHSRGQIHQGDRWLQRVFGRNDLVAIRNATRASRKDYIFSVKSLIFL